MQTLSHIADMSVTRWHELAQDWLAWAPRLQVVLYEDLVLDPVRETERMMAFLRLAPDPRRLSCLAAAEHVGGAFHRAGGLEVDPYTQEHRQLLAWAMDRVNLTLQQRHHTALPAYNYTPATAKCVDM